MQKYFLFFSVIGLSMTTKAQLTFQNGAVLNIQDGAKVIVQGNVNSMRNIPGTGTLVLNGSSLQTLNMNGFTIPRLEIDNNSDVALQSSPAGISQELLFTNGRIETGNQDLVFGNTASITGAGPGRFIWTNGIGRVGHPVYLEPKLFPLGATMNSYSPVTIANPGDPDLFFVRIVPGVYTNGVAGTPLTEKAVNRTWLIDESLPGGSNASLTMQWNLAEELPFFNSGNVYLSHFHQSAWDPGIAQAATYVNNYGSITRHNISDFSPFAVTSTAIAGPVPVTLLDFTASALNRKVMTKWKTSFELNTSHFEIERSADGSSFTYLGSVTAAGNSTSDRNYSFPDNQPFRDVNFYRLKMLDVDGAFVYSKTVVVRFDGKPVFQVFPNPVVNILNIQAEGSGSATLYITDAIGRRVKEEKVVLNGLTSLFVNVESLAAGVYNLVLVAGQVKDQQQFIKHNLK